MSTIALTGYVCVAPGCGHAFGPLKQGDVAMAYAQHAYDAHPGGMTPLERVLVGCECKPWRDDPHGRGTRCEQCCQRIAAYARTHSVEDTARHFRVARRTIRRVKLSHP